MVAKEKLTYVCDKSFSYLFCCIPVEGMWLNILYQGICSKGTHNFNFLENIFLLFQNPSTRTNVGIFVKFLYVYILTSNISSKMYIIIEKGSHKLNFPLKIRSSNIMLTEKHSSRSTTARDCCVDKFYAICIFSYII